MTSGPKTSVSLKPLCDKLPHKPIRKCTVPTLGN